MILVVEDDEDVREAMRLGLESRGYTVKEAGNGFEALDVIRHEHPDLMILDLMMPKMNGWEVLEQMKQMHIDDVPVCVISALSDRAPDDVTVLSKPFQLSDLVTVVERVCAPDPPSHEPRD
ncbi:MAG TPA: response regulator [Kofleriaceae bacterium]|nr:response regulator [Kofleriaceae bacterium]